MNKHVALTLLLVLALALLLPSAAMAQQTITVNLAQQNGSGVSGTATLTDLGGGRTRVVVQVDPAGNPAMPAHIHEGTCANLNPAPKWPLQTVANGQSTTEVSASLAEITSGQTAINLHKSAQEASVYVACGNIQAALAQTPGALPRTGGGPISPALLGGMLAALGAALALGGALLRRQRS